MTKTKIINTISKAIKAADTSYFFENYTTQAEQVITSLQKAGYVITTAKPTAKMIQAGIKAINLGLVDASELASRMFVDMHQADE